jgi:NADH dehydrogenase FAD-containing subunit
MANGRPELLVIGAQFTGTFVARELRKSLSVTVVDAKEYLEYTPGILRAYVKPDHWDSLAFMLQPVLVRNMGVKLIVGEVTSLTAEPREARIRILEDGREQAVAYDYCVVCAGCNYGQLNRWGESLWSPTVQQEARLNSQWADIDERYYEGRRRHVLSEYEKLKSLNARREKVVVVGAGFIGVEWATEMNHFFPDLDLTIIDFLPRCLGPLPESAAKYCSSYMQKVGVKEVYTVKFAPDSARFWHKIGVPEKADQNPREGIYYCQGVKASNSFMPAETLSDRGPGGGGWIHFNTKLQVAKKPPPGNPGQCEVWGGGRVFAVGDCNYGCIHGTGQGEYRLSPMPKICYPGEEQAAHACKNVLRLAEAGRSSGSSLPSDQQQQKMLLDTWWPWGAGMYSISLGPKDANFVVGGSAAKGSGRTLLWGRLAAWQKDSIERTKMWECKNYAIGRMIWHFVHHTPVNLWGQGPCCVK